MHLVFTNKWATFHTPIMTTTFNLQPEFIRREKKTRVLMKDVCCHLLLSYWSAHELLRPFQNDSRE